METMLSTVVRNLLEYDVTPPDDEYSPFTYGESVASHIRDADIDHFVKGIVSRLPSGLVASFLGGLCTARREVALESTLVASIPGAGEVTTAAVIVDILRDVCKYDDGQVFEELANLLKDHHNASSQDRICFAMWSLICGESYDIPSGEVRRYTGHNVASQIEGIMSRHGLDEYASGLLKQCLSVLSKGSTKKRG